MKVSVIAATPDAEKVVSSAARVCYSDEPADTIMHSISSDKTAKRISDCIDRGHFSVLEHAFYTFSIEGISRVTTHQLVRHRLASFSQQSQRYVKFRDPSNYIIPDRISEEKKLLKKYTDFMTSAFDLYHYFVSAGISPEDARYLLPSAAASNIVVTMNARELHHFFSLRCCKKAQWEIRALAWKMLRSVMKISPIIFEKAGPECVNGRCSQKDWKCLEKMKRINGYSGDEKDGK